ncbi:helix-turn-helix domain-containing protein [Pseudohongiella acticola]|nr:helix-turn-helix transcriptional regulator [Pseudohongiella acticola]
MNTATIIISSMAISQFVFLAAHFLIRYQNTTGKMVAGLCLCTIAYLLNESLDLADGSLVNLGLGIMATAAPFLLWLIASRLFVDEREKHTFAWLALALCYVLDVYRAVGFAGNENSAESTILELAAYFVPQLILLGFPLHAIYLAIRGYESDLLEERRKFRIAFITGLGVVVVFIVTCDILNDVLQGGLAGGGDPYVILASLCLFLVALIFNLGSIQSSNSTLKIVSDNAAVDATTESIVNPAAGQDQSLVRAIERAMEEDKLYQEPGLTIAELATHIGVLEYKARQLINKSMQYKNFNQFLNNYRISEACQLINSTKYPVSRIAMDVGYSSLSVFNRAFKERTGATPSEYRKQQGH